MYTLFRNFMFPFVLKSTSFSRPNKASSQLPVATTATTPTTHPHNHTNAAAAFTSQRIGYPQPG